MKTQHTPGPWHVEQPFGEPGTYVAVTFPGFSPGLVCRLIDQARTPEGIANARLIAAAPDLLAALEETRDFLMGGDSLESADPWVRELISDTIDPAIARARGES